MLIKMLSPSDKDYLLRLARLIAIADKPLLWDGKRHDEITSETNLDSISIEEGKIETQMLEDMEAASPHYSTYFSSSIESLFIEKIRRIPLQKADLPESRVTAATTVLREVLAEHQCEVPSVPKLMLFELMLVALCGGSITSIEWVLLKEVQHHYKVKDFIFEDLLERAETMSREVAKTISIILE